jgi:hypothetical protein
MHHDNRNHNAAHLGNRQRDRARLEKPYFGAVPYLRAMHSLRDVTDAYGYDDGRSIVMYFLANANTWRGDTARRVKAELKDLLKASARK